MKIHVYTQEQWKDEHTETLHAMATGIPGADIRPVESYSIKDAPDIAVVYGLYKKAVPMSYHRGRVFEVQRYLGKRTLVLEKGYVHRDRYYSAGWEGMNGRANFMNCAMDGDRAAELGVELKPWDLSGENILFIGQIPWDASVEHMDFFGWIANTIPRIRRITDRPIVYRQHPLSEGDFTPIFEELSKHGVTIENEDGKVPLEESFANARTVVTCNSNVGVDAMLAGQAVLSFDRGSMVWGISRHHVEYLLDPGLIIAGVDREQWLNDIAYAQWTLEEMEQGKAWAHLTRDALEVAA